MKTIRFYVATIMAIAMLASCSSDDDGNGGTLPIPVEEEDDPTELSLTFVNQTDATDTVILTWDDANGNLVIDADEQTVEGKFNTGKVYNASLRLFAEDEDFLAADILENQETIDAHFFVYETSLGFTMTRASDDNARSDGAKLGVKTIWTAGSTAGTGNITIQLFHESASIDDSDGFGSAAGTDTDIDISFNVEIESSVE